MIFKSLPKLSFAIRRQLKTFLPLEKNKISLLKNIIPEVNNYIGDDWKLYKYLINLHENKLSNNKFETEKTKFNYYKNFNIEKKNNNYIKIELPFTDENDLFNMFLIKWLPNSYTPHHLHSFGGCILKPLEGELRETVYGYNFKEIDKNIITTQKNKELLINENNSIFNKNILTINYIDNSIGSHTIYNNINKSSYSLHIYGKNILETILQEKKNKREHSIIKFFPLEVY